MCVCAGECPMSTVWSICFVQTQMFPPDTSGRSYFCGKQENKEIKSSSVPFFPQTKTSGTNEELPVRLS